MLLVYAGVGAEACGGNEKNQLHGGTWMPEGGPAFIPVSDVDSFSLIQQPTQKIAHQSNEEPRCVKKVLVLQLLILCTSCSCVGLGRFLTCRRKLVCYSKGQYRTIAAVKSRKCCMLPHQQFVQS